MQPDATARSVEIIELRRITPINSTDLTATNRPQRGPRTIVISDLVLLVVGSAISMSLPQGYRPNSRISIGVTLLPEWITYVLFSVELLTKYCVAFLPFRVIRALRRGQTPDAGEWMTVLAGLVPLAARTCHANLVMRFARWYLLDVRAPLGYPVTFPDPYRTEPGGRPHTIFFDSRHEFPTGLTMEYAYDVWAALSGMIFLGAVSAFLLGRKRLPSWAKTVLIALAAVMWMNMLRCFVFPILWWQVRAFHGMNGRVISRAIVLGLLGILPTGVIFGIPLVRLLAGFRREGVRAWNWLDWITTPIATIVLISTAITDGVFLILMTR